MNDNQFEQSSCNYLNWKATIPSHKMYGLTHDYLIKSFLKLCMWC